MVYRDLWIQMQRDIGIQGYSDIVLYWKVQCGPVLPFVEDSFTPDILTRMTIQADFF